MAALCLMTCPELPCCAALRVRWVRVRQCHLLLTMLCVCWDVWLASAAAGTAPCH